MATHCLRCAEDVQQQARISIPGNRFRANLCIRNFNFSFKQKPQKLCANMPCSLDAFHGYKTFFVSRTRDNGEFTTIFSMNTQTLYFFKRFKDC